MNRLTHIHKITTEYTHVEIIMRDGAVLTANCEGMATWKSLTAARECAPDAACESIELPTFPAHQWEVKEATTENTGGGVMVDCVTMKTGEVLTITADLAVAYKSVAEQEEDWMDGSLCDTRTVGFPEVRFVDAAEAMETSQEIMDAIADVADNDEQAWIIWEDPEYLDALDPIIERVKAEGRPLSDFRWGAAGYNWAN